MGGPTTRLGAVGAGTIFEAYERAAAALPGVELVAVADVDPARRAAAARLGREVVGTVDELVELPIDAVLVLTPNATHAATVELCLRRSLDTLCEKPLASTVAAAAELVGLAREAGSLLYVASHYRHRPEVVRLHDAIPGGVVGFDLVHHERWDDAPSWYFDPALSGGGVLLDVGVNHVDWISAHVSGLEPVEVELVFGERRVEVECSVLWRHSRGEGRMQLSWSARSPRRLTTIELEGGERVVVDHVAHTIRRNGAVEGPWPNEEYLGVLREFLAIRARQVGHAETAPLAALSVLRRAYELADAPFLA